MERAQISSVRTAPLAQLFIEYSIVFVAFQQAFTFNVGFPLKISEILVILALGSAAIFGVGSSTARAPRMVILFLSVFSIAAAGAFLRVPPAGPPAAGYASYDRDMLQYAAYGVLVLLACVLSVKILEPDRFGARIGDALRLCAVYCSAQLLLFLQGRPDALEVVNGTTQSGSTYGPLLPRNGPFLEGNYLGFFAGSCLIICFHRRDYIGGVLGVAMLIYSQSTSAMIGVLCAAAILAACRPSVRRIMGLVAIIGILIVGFYASSTIHAATLSQVAKLGIETGAQERGNSSYSRESRSLNSTVGFRMANDEPLLGVGPGRYGLNFHRFLMDRERSEWGTIRPIANNGYAHVASESGYVSLTIFILLLVRLAWFSVLSVRSAPRHWGLVLLSGFVLISTNAVPSWSTLPLWFAIGYLSTALRTSGGGGPLRVARHARDRGEGEELHARSGSPVREGIAPSRENTGPAGSGR